MEVTPLIEDGEALSSMPGLGVLERSAGGRHIAGVGEQSLHWFAAYTAPRHEKAVLRHLDVRHVESFLPLYTSVRRWKNGCRVAVEQPLFPGYVFVHIERRSWVKVLQVPGVVSLVSSGREPSALQTGEIESLRVGLPQRQYEPHPKVAVGDKVRIVEGPFSGMSGVLVRKKSDFRVVLTLELIMQSVAVEVGLNEVEPLGK
jgi:transcription antitermination factor NusG